MIDPQYRFRSVKVSDLPLLAKWLKTPEVECWYENPDYIHVLQRNLENEHIRMQLVLLNEEPIAYVQDYVIHAWPVHHLGFLPEHSRGLDTFIGSSRHIGKGHGTNYLKLLTEQMFESGIPALGIDPHPDNIPARRVYKKVGFDELRELDSDWGRVLLMSFCPNGSNANPFVFNTRR